MYSYARGSFQLRWQSRDQPTNWTADVSLESPSPPLTDQRSRTCDVPREKQLDSANSVEMYLSLSLYPGKTLSLTHIRTPIYKRNATVKQGLG